MRYWVMRNDPEFGVRQFGSPRGYASHAEARKVASCAAVQDGLMIVGELSDKRPLGACSPHMFGELQRLGEAAAQVLSAEPQDEEVQLLCMLALECYHAAHHPRRLRARPAAPSQEVRP